MRATPGLRRCVALHKASRAGPTAHQMTVAYEELHGCCIRRPEDTCAVRKEFLRVALDVLATAIATEARRAETAQTGSVHEGAGPKDIAQTTASTPGSNP
jgi:hypothetical protein